MTGKIRDGVFEMKPLDEIKKIIASHMDTLKFRYKEVDQR